MILNCDDMKPIYVQIAEWIENEILGGNLKADEKVYSQYQLSEMYNINPATAAKGLNILVEDDILYKKRGLGMFVSPNAHDLIFTKRKSETIRKIALEFIREADRLDLKEEDMFSLIKSIKKEMGD